MCQFPRNDVIVLLDIELHYFISKINGVNKTTRIRRVHIFLHTQFQYTELVSTVNSAGTFVQHEMRFLKRRSFFSP